MKPDLVKKKKILIAPLNWGLGHATRCIPIINALINNNFEPVLASDGDALEFLKKEFPKLKLFELPSYKIHYAKKGKYLKYKLLLNSPNILKAIKKEQQDVEQIIESEKVTGIISDNRFGVYSNKVPSVYITHQINVLSGNTTFLSSKLHQKTIENFDECWVPDYLGPNNLAGKLSQGSYHKLNLKYIGPISRFDHTFPLKKEVKKTFDILVLLSGPEPQRSLLEIKLLNELASYKKKVLFVRGIISDKEKQQEKDLTENKNINIIDFLGQKELQKAILNSKIIISRSGYSTIMDLDKLSAKAFFIPTPGQDEQEYLANLLEEKRIAPYSSQKDFKLELIEKRIDYSGFVSKTIENPKIKSFDFSIFSKKKD